MKIKDLKAEAERMVAAGEMPSLEEVLKAIAEVRKEYRQKILDARKEANFKMPLSERAKGLEKLRKK
jgi:uncharacterized damage-inducible protein DinB